MINITRDIIQRFLTALLLSLIAVACVLFASPIIISLFLGLILFITLAIEWPAFKSLWLTPFYPVLPFLLLILLNNSAERALLLFMIITIALYEISAYLIGKSCGTLKLCPAISPGKTWQGALGGYLTCIVGAWIYYSSFRHIDTVSWFAPLTLIILAATIGDLFESYLKRKAHLKDSGWLLPGHGGILDRMDGILGAILIVYPCRIWFMKLLELL